MKQEDLLKRKVDLNDMVTMQEKMEEAQTDDTPFAIVKDDGVKVAGDVNKTEIKSRDYSVRFRFHKSHAKDIDPKDIVKTIDDYVVVKIEFNDVYIVPRRDLDITAAIVRVIPYFQKIREDDLKIEKRTPEELMQMVQEVNDDIGDDLYNLVAAVLNVDKSIKDNMLLTDVLDVVQRLPEDFPEVFREADAFFE